MLDFLPHIFSWISKQWQNASVLWRIVFVLIGVLVIGGVVALIPQVGQLGALFLSLPDAVKGYVFLAMVIGLVGIVLYAYNRATRVDELKTKYEQQKAELESARAEVKQNDARLALLLNVESRVKLWQKECKIARHPFVPASQRKARFVTVLNLKGGVGKTNLTANLAACLALGTKPFRVLLVDLDFQGTLGIATVDRPFREIQEKNGHFVQQLLTSETANEQTLAKLSIGMMGVPNVQVVLAADSLDLVDFELQARFFLDPNNDPRYRLLTHLHRPWVTDHFDLVLFDCPPRVTASVVNGLLCSDHILIPTRLDGGSIDAVPRTISWVKSLGSLCQATFLGVVATQVNVRDGKPVKADQLNFDRLRNEVQSSVGKDILFQDVIRTTPTALNPKPGLVAGTTETGRQVFAKIVSEFSRRIKP